MSNTTTEPTRLVSATALDNELGRRANNKKRVAKAIADGATKAEAKKVKVRAKAFYLPELSQEDVATIKDGGVVTLQFRSGRTETVGLKVA